MHVIAHLCPRWLTSPLLSPSHFSVTSHQLFIPLRSFSSTTRIASTFHTMIPNSLDHPKVCVEAQDPRFAKDAAKLERPNGDLNNTAAMRVVLMPHRDPHFAHRSLAIPPSKDDPLVRSRYRPFLLPEEIQREDWISRLELATATELSHTDMELRGERLRVLVLYGSLRQR